MIFITFFTESYLASLLRINNSVDKNAIIITYFQHLAASA